MRGLWVRSEIHTPHLYDAGHVLLAINTTNSATGMDKLEPETTHRTWSIVAQTGIRGEWMTFLCFQDRIVMLPWKHRNGGVRVQFFMNARKNILYIFIKWHWTDWFFFRLRNSLLAVCCKYHTCWGGLQSCLWYRAYNIYKAQTRVCKLQVDDIYFCASFIMSSVNCRKKYDTEYVNKIGCL